MRKDMNEVIIEVGRHSGYGSKGKEKYLNRERARDFEDHPIREKMTLWGNDKSQGDKLNPLRRYLRKNIGRNWDGVYSDICSVNDKRKMISFHLLDHLKDYVRFPGNAKKEYPWIGPTFFVDTDGTLQETKRIVYKVKEDPIKQIALEDGSRYVLEDGIWYRCWTETYLKPYSEEYLAEENGEVVIKRTPQRMVKRTKDYKFQCGKKQLKFIRDWLVMNRRK